MKSMSVFLDIAKFADLRWKKGLCHVIHTFFGSSLDKVYLYLVLSLKDMCDRF